MKAAPGAILDSDGDRMPDYWELQHGLDPNNPDGDEGALSDTDGDGAGALLEFLADFDPSDAADGLLLTPIISPSGGTWKLEFPTIPNRIYQAEQSTSLSAWTNLGASFSVPAPNPAYQWLDPSPIPGKRYYRLRIRLP